MRFKKLELLGFKSFADKTEILFDAGVTCVVGPNGCGKSNISDSIRWVLGERSAKLLRGSKMEDVIFAGTDFRKPLAYAEVSLTLDNEDRGLPIDYNEVVISRRMYRSGESEYFINKTACRLKDVQDLILDTGIGSSAYSMIEQGRIDYILNADSDEKRFLIEEAAGISKYKVKKEEAIRKLERTEENLLRLKDIVHEVSRNIQYAERQAKRAKRYQEQFEKLKNLEIRKSFADLAALERSQAELEGMRSMHEAEMKGLDTQIFESRQQLQILGEKLREVQARSSQEETKRYEIRSEIQRCEQQLKYHQEKRIELATRRGEIQQEKSQLADSIARNQSEIESKQKEASDLDAERLNLQDSLLLMRDLLAQVECHLAGVRSELEANKLQMFESAAESARLRNDYHRLNVFVETSGEQKKKQEAGRNRYEQEVQSWNLKKIECETQLGQIDAQLAQLQQAKLGIEGEILMQEHRACEIESRLHSQERLLHEKKTYFRLLQEIDTSEGMSEDAFLDGLEPGLKSALKSLRQIVRVRPGYEECVENALGSYVRSVVADSPEIAREVWARSQSQKLTSFGLLIGGENHHTVADDLPGPQHPDILHPLCDAVDIADGYDPLLRPLFKNVFVVESVRFENFQDLVNLAKSHVLVSKDGTLLGPGGRILFPKAAANAEQSFFRRTAEMEVLSSEILKITSELENLAKQQSEADSALAQTKARAAKISDDEVALKISRESHESMAQGMRERLGSFQRELDLIFSESQETQIRVEEAVLQKDELQQQLKQAEDRESQVRLEQERLFGQIKKLEEQKAETHSKWSDEKNRDDKLAERIRMLTEAVQFLETHQTRDRERIDLLTAENERICQRETQLDGDDNTLRESLIRHGEAERSSDLQLALIRQEKEAHENELAAVESGLKEIQDKRHVIETSLHGSEMKKMDLSYQERTVYERMAQSYRIDLHALKGEDYPPLEAEGADSQQTIEELRAKVESLGAVNLLAIEEYDELKGRYDFLLAQQKDLEDARDSLMEAIRRINRTTKDLFAQTFEQVQKNFAEYFTLLFRGGEARLQLLDETNPLESGVDIVVRPPGKKLQHLSLLSGGEKALTAMALLFALFKIKPSPFCVLDEADAPLDEANVDRFLAVVKSFQQTTQFIIVTHNRKTIAMGDMLYGVTMEEAGVSKIVSVKVAATQETIENPENPEPETDDDIAPVLDNDETVTA